MIGIDKDDDNDRRRPGHDDYDIGSQHHDDALRKIHRMVDMNINGWLMLDNE